jgi:hypothetical protein
MLCYPGTLRSAHARFLRDFAFAGKRHRYPRAVSIPSAAWLPVLVIQSEQRPTLLDPSLTLTRTYHSAIPGKRGDTNSLAYAGLASSDTPQQPPTAHS